MSDKCSICGVEGCRPDWHPDLRRRCYELEQELAEARRQIQEQRITIEGGEEIQALDAEFEWTMQIQRLEQKRDRLRDGLKKLQYYITQPSDSCNEWRVCRGCGARCVCNADESYNYPENTPRCQPGCWINRLLLGPLPEPEENNVG